MSFTTLITSDQLAPHLTDPDWVIFDGRFSLADVARGRRDYQKSHIFRAIYAHLNEDLAGPIVPGHTGRHPLPDVAALSRFFSRSGLAQNSQVIAYDDAGGALAARVWWLLRWLGHTAVAILDGGWPQWLKDGHPTTDQIVPPTPRAFVPRPRSDPWLTTDQVLARLTDPHFKLFDARTADRYRGENEMIDPVAGHIPGAISAPYTDNLTPEGRFKSPAELRARFEALLGDTPADQTAFYCGSGVTAAHNLIALEYAGLGDAQLYAGSWSEWITAPARPIVTGVDGRDVSQSTEL